MSTSVAGSSLVSLQVVAQLQEREDALRILPDLGAELGDGGGGDPGWQKNLVTSFQTALPGVKGPLAPNASSWPPPPGAAPLQSSVVTGVLLGPPAHSSP